MSHHRSTTPTQLMSVLRSVHMTHLILSELNWKRTISDTTPLSKKRKTSRTCKIYNKMKAQKTEFPNFCRHVTISFLNMQIGLHNIAS